MATTRWLVRKNLERSATTSARVQNAMATATSVLTSTPSGTPTKANETPMPPAPSTTIQITENGRKKPMPCFLAQTTRSYCARPSVGGSKRIDTLCLAETDPAAGPFEWAGEKSCPPRRWA